MNFVSTYALVLLLVGFRRSVARVERPRQVDIERRRLEGNEDEGVHREEFHLAHKESFSFFDDVPESAWNLLKERVREMPAHANPINPLLQRENPEMWYQINWEPNFSCMHERRVGGMGDGPKWVCNPHRIPAISEQRMQTGGEKCLVYSVGSNGNFLFEESLQREIGVDTCEIHIFDPDDYSGTMPPNMFFHPWGIEASVNKEMASNFKSFQQTVDELGHKGRVMDIFKIDCEGCEWRTYQDWFSSDIDMRQILVETHFVPPNANHFFETLKNEGFVIFHKEPNTWSAGGKCQEYAFVKLEQSFFQ